MTVGKCADFSFPKEHGFTHSCRGGPVRAAKGGSFNPGGQKGKLHRELGISTSQTIPTRRLASATRSNNPEIRRDATRAETMKKWNHKR